MDTYKHRKRKDVTSVLQSHLPPVCPQPKCNYSQPAISMGSVSQPTTNQKHSEKKIPGSLYLNNTM